MPDAPAPSPAPPQRARSARSGALAAAVAGAVIGVLLVRKPAHPGAERALAPHWLTSPMAICVGLWIAFGETFGVGYAAYRRESWALVPWVI
jgi:hypothetical protein